MKPIGWLLQKYQAMAWLVFGQRETAGKVFEAMLKANPDDVYALASRAQLAVQRGDKVQALMDMKRLCALDGGSAHAWYNYAYLLHDCGYVGEAEGVFKKALELSPKLDLAWYGLSLVHIQQKRFDDAVTTLKKNTELQPMSPYGWYHLARVYVDRKEPDEARKVIAHLRGFEPKVADQLVRETGLVA
jgi:predicted Zn-dependent protease